MCLCWCVYQNSEWKMQMGSYSDEGYFCKYKGHSVTARVKTLAFSTFKICFPELFEHFLIIALQYVELKLDAVAGINENQFNRKHNLKHKYQGNQ